MGGEVDERSLLEASGLQDAEQRHPAGDVGECGGDVVGRDRAWREKGSTCVPSFRRRMTALEPIRPMAPAMTTFMLSPSPGWDGRA
ncbi:hypothetical protein [Streptomyces sp. TLI_55]|uniref:hypothetical protein n=1 Tax=Streptomyces sp. TLI_55 TaxID=1938861 RepID=UPI000BE3E3A0|nr:hypothetical protein [Streptomyces sp. TLI_55]